jgi:ABC-type amino acid transport substrate-binding protein
MINLRDKIIKALLAHANGEIQKHLANVEIYLNNPVGIGEHSDITGAIQDELDKIARWEDQISIINKYLKPQLHAVK